VSGNGNAVFGRAHLGRQRPPVELSAVSAAVKQAADKATPGVKWLDAYQDTEDGQTVYSLEGEDGKMHDVAVDVTAAGKVTSIEMEVELEEVPAAITAAATRKIPPFKAEGAYSIRRGADVLGGQSSERAFALDGADSDERDISLEITADGKITSLEREIAASAVRQVVIKALQEKLPRLQIVTAHEIHEGETLTGYAIEGTRPAKGKAKGKAKKAEGKVGEEITVFVSADGKEIEIDEG